MVEWQDEGLKAPHVSMLATLYSLFVVAVLLFISRVVIRIVTSKRVFWDDGWALAAILCLLAHVVIVHTMLNPMYITVQMGKKAVADAMSGLPPPPPPTTPEAIAAATAILDKVVFYIKMQFTETMIFWTCLWLVKASFLAFFKRLTTNVKAHYIAWWVIAVITGLSYIGAVITYPVSCSKFQPGDCEAPRNVYLSIVSLRYSTAMDIITDLMIMALPISLAWKVKLPWTSRIALLGVFSLGLLIIIFAVLRIIFTNTHDTRPELTWLALWSVIEASVACIVCNLAPFKILFSKRGQTYGSNSYSYGKPKATNEKSESHELASSNRPERMGYSKTADSSTTPLSSQPDDSVDSERFPAMHLPRGVQRGFLKTNITGGNHSGTNVGGGIMVTEEFGTKYGPASQQPAVGNGHVQSQRQSQSRTHSQAPSMRTTWIDRTSDDSSERVPPSAKSFASWLISSKEVGV